MKRIIALLLAVCTVLCFAACADTADTITSNTTVTSNTTSTSGTTASTTGTTSATTSPGTSDSEKINFGGHKFTFAIDIHSVYGYEVDGEGQSAEAIYQPIKKRNNDMETLYNCKIKTDYIGNGTVENDFNTNKSTIDVVCSAGANRSVDRYIDLNTLDIDFSTDWWMDSFMKESAMDGKNFYTICYGSLSAFETTQVIIFNKALKDGNDIVKNIDFYSLVSNNEWTLDKFSEIVKLSAVDADNNGTIETYNNDTYGLMSDTKFAPTSFYFGAGGRFSNNIAAPDGTYYFASAIDSNAELITDKIISIYADSSATWASDVMLISEMKNGKTMFVTDEIYRLRDYSGLNIGILPFPKGENADRYISYPEANMYSISVPKTCTDLERISKFLDLYAKHSKETVYPEFKKWIASKADGENTEKMLDYILENLASDPAQRHNFAALYSDYPMSVTDGENLFKDNKSEINEAMLRSAANHIQKMAGK